MNITLNTFCPQLFNARDTKAMMRPNLNVADRYDRNIGKYDPKDGEYVPPEYFMRKRDKAWGALKRYAMPIFIIVGFGALIVASKAADAQMTGDFHG